MTIPRADDPASTTGEKSLPKSTSTHSISDIKASLDPSKSDLLDLDDDDDPYQQPGLTPADLASIASRSHIFDQTRTCLRNGPQFIHHHASCFGTILNIRWDITHVMGITNNGYLQVWAMPDGNIIDFEKVVPSPLLISCFCHHRNSRSIIFGVDEIGTATLTLVQIEIPTGVPTGEQRVITKHREIVKRTACFPITAHHREQQPTQCQYHASMSWIIVIHGCEISALSDQLDTVWSHNIVTSVITPALHDTAIGTHVDQKQHLITCMTTLESTTPMWLVGTQSGYVCRISAKKRLDGVMSVTPHAVKRVTEMVVANTSEDEADIVLTIEQRTNLAQKKEAERARKQMEDGARWAATQQETQQQQQSTQIPHDAHHVVRASLDGLLSTKEQRQRATTKPESHLESDKWIHPPWITPPTYRQTGHSTAITSLACVACDKHDVQVVVGCSDGTTHLMRASNGEELCVFMDPYEMGLVRVLSPIVSTCCTPDLSHILTLDARGIIRRWDVNNRTLIGMTYTEGYQHVISMSLIHNGYWQNIHEKLMSQQQAQHKESAFDSYHNNTSITASTDTTTFTTASTSTSTSTDTAPRSSTLNLDSGYYMTLIARDGWSLWSLQSHPNQPHSSIHDTIQMLDRLDTSKEQEMIRFVQSWKRQQHARIQAEQNAANPSATPTTTTTTLASPTTSTTLAPPAVTQLSGPSSALLSGPRVSITMSHRMTISRTFASLDMSLAELHAEYAHENETRPRVTTTTHDTDDDDQHDSEVEQQLVTSIQVSESSTEPKT